VIGLVRPAGGWRVPHFEGRVSVGRRKSKMLKRAEEVSREWDEEEAPERRELIILLGC
jgi:hypothetical protein